jgi:hypothetical protein
MKYIIALLVAVSTTVHAEPWVMAGQTRMAANSALNNPQGNDIGAIGQNLVLPYTVPDGCVLKIDGYGVEAYDYPRTSVIFLWAGDPDGPATYRVRRATLSVGARGATNWVTGLNYNFPGGTVINMRLQNATSYDGAVFSWGISGNLNCP